MPVPVDEQVIQTEALWPFCEPAFVIPVPVVTSKMPGAKVAVTPTPEFAATPVVARQIQLEADTLVGTRPVVAKDEYTKEPPAVVPSKMLRDITKIPLLALIPPATPFAHIFVRVTRGAKLTEGPEPDPVRSARILEIEIPPVPRRPFQVNAAEEVKVEPISSIV